MFFEVVVEVLAFAEFHDGAEGVHVDFEGVVEFDDSGVVDAHLDFAFAVGVAGMRGVVLKIWWLRIFLVETKFKNLVSLYRQK